MAQPKVAKKSARHRKDKSVRTQCARPSHHEHATHDGRGKQDAPESVPALAAPAPDGDAVQADAPSTALVPARSLLPAVCERAGHAAPADHAVRGKKRTVATFAQALLISVALTGALIFGLGMFKRAPAEMQVAQAAAPAEIADPASANRAAGNGAAPRTSSAVKQGASTSRYEKNTRHPDTRRTSTPIAQRASEDSKTGKAEAQKVAKSSAKTQDARKAKVHETHATVTDGQHGTLLASKASGTPNSYAQCQALDSFLRREQCKWQVCNGKWGQDGCPSYAHANTEIN